MQSFYFVPAILIFTLGLSACTGTSSRMDTDFISNLHQETKYGIYTVNTDHPHNNKSGQISAIGVIPAMAMQNEIDTKNSGEDYAIELDEAVMAIIEQGLSDSPLLSYINRSDSGSSSNEPLAGFPKTLVEAAPYISDNGLDFVVTTKITYGIASGWTKPLYMQIDWKFWDSAGCPLRKIRTMKKTTETFDIFPSSKDKKYKDVYLSLSRSNTEQFLNALGIKMSANVQDQQS